MPAAQHESLVRAAAAQAVVKRFRHVPFAWGKADCGRMTALLLRGMGHKAPLARYGSYASEAGAFRALKRCGYDSMEAALDGFGLERIPHAYVRIADLMGLRGQGIWLGIGVYLGNGRVFAFTADPCLGHVYQPRDGVETAWRVPCLR